MPDTITIPDRVRKVISETLGFCDQPEKVTDDASLIDDLGADSLDVIELTVEIENEFDVSLDDDQVDAWRTVGDVIKSVEAQRHG